MQSRIREKRSYQRVRRARKYSVACVGAILSILFASCTTLNKKTKTAPVLQKVSNVCFSHEGRGRFETSRNKYLFDYSTAFRDEKYLIGVDIPIHGEEVFFYEFGDELKVGGDFYKRMISSANHSDSIRLNKFLLNYGDFLRFLHSGNEEKSKSCVQNDTGLKCKNFVVKNHEEGLAVSFGDKQSVMKISYRDASPFYKRVTAIYRSKNKKNFSKYKLIFFLNECNNQKN